MAKHDVFIAQGNAIKEGMQALGVEDGEFITVYYVKVAGGEFGNGRVYGYLDKDLNYNSTILNESISTPDFEEFKAFLIEEGSQL
jgi:hypothetical protein